MVTPRIRDNRFLDGSEISDSVVSMIILNQPVHRASFLGIHSKINGLLICADGGSNRLYQSTKNEED